MDSFFLFPLLTIVMAGSGWLWFLLVLLGLALVGLIWWLFRTCKRCKELPGTPPAEEIQPPVMEERISSVIQVVPDDLKLIEGIGPKIEQLLHAAGIQTFQQLADANVDTLRKLMLDANLRIADPTTWPEQARLAAAGAWDQLKTFQEALKGGRKVA